jgi:hypothetical protein
MPTEPLDFYARAERLGHSVDQLRAGHAITSIIHVPNVDALKGLIDPQANTADRQALGRQLLGTAPLPHPDADASHQALVSRVHAYLYDMAGLAATDKQRVSSAFPLAVHTESSPNKTITGLWELGTSQSGVVVVNVGTLTMQPGSAVVVRNSILQFTVDTVVRQGTAPSGYYDFNVLGVTGSVGGVGSPAGQGGSGERGAGGTCSSPGIAGSAGGDGQRGTAGPTGGSGHTGSDGLPSMPATISITTDISGPASQLTIYTSSGGGGTGGTGGQGGLGGPGGPGGNGANCGCEGTRGGHGGPGGPGGPGGQGGTGGNAVPAAGNVVIKLPSKLASRIAPAVKRTAQPGPGGAGGAGGQGGPGGGGGGGGKHESGGDGGGQGAAGSQGPSGPSGGQTGGPAEVTVIAY